MHIEILVEDSSGRKLLEILAPQLLGPQSQPHTWRTHAYKGVGRIPKGMKPNGDPAKRILLDRLPRILKGYAKTPGIDAVVVMLDADTQDCAAFLAELKQLARACGPNQRTMFRLAIEEMEAWYFGDRAAVLAAYPAAKRKLMDTYVQDSVCGTWEVLADVLHPGGSATVKKAGWPLPGQLKHEWAAKIGPHLNVDRNVSPSFIKLRDGLRNLAAPAD